MFKSFLRAVDVDWHRWRQVWVLRLLVMVGLSAAVIGWFYKTDPDHGADTLLRIQFLSWAFVATLPAYLIGRALGGNIRTETLIKRAVGFGEVGPAVVLLGHLLLRGMIYVGLLAFCMASHAASPPAAALPLLPLLHAEQITYWPDMPDVPTLGAQVEQETCPSLKSRSCWSPHAELKTAREYGFGLGQITITSAFDNFAAARGLDSSLKGWGYADRYDPARQLRTLVLMDRASYRSLRLVLDARERLAMTFAAYNGGLGGVNSDRRLCALTEGCDPQVWFGHVERHSLKKRAATQGYGRSFFDINREYVTNIMLVRRARYAGALS